MVTGNRPQSANTPGSVRNATTPTRSRIPGPSVPKINIAKAAADRRSSTEYIDSSSASRRKSSGENSGAAATHVLRRHTHNPDIPFVRYRPSLQTANLRFWFHESESQCRKYVILPCFHPCVRRACGKRKWRPVHCAVNPCACARKYIEWHVKATPSPLIA